MSLPFTSGKLNLIEIHCTEKNVTSAQPFCRSAHPGQSGVCVGRGAMPKFLQVLQIAQG